MDSITDLVRAIKIFWQLNQLSATFKFSRGHGQFPDDSMISRNCAPQIDKRAWRATSAKYTNFKPNLMLWRDRRRLDDVSASASLCKKSLSGP